MLGIDVHDSNSGSTGVGINHFLERDRTKMAVLNGDECVGSTSEQILRRTIAEITRVLHVKWYRIGTS